MSDTMPPPADKAEQAREPKFAPIGSYVVTETHWATQCEDCGATIDEGYASATAAREAWDNLRSLEGFAHCDNCWIDPDEVAAARSGVSE